eukprot:5601843-Ditylum_brightwellii.AAC.1
MFTVLLLSHEIDWGANSIMLELLLEGNYKRTKLLHTAKLLLEHCKREMDAPLIAEKLSLSGILARKKGMYKHITYIHGKALKEAQYQLKTAMGVSTESYSHSNLYPIYGSDQGAINFPNIWLAISSTLADIYGDEAQGATFVSLDKQINTKLTLQGLVDDITNQ